MKIDRSQVYTHLRVSTADTLHIPSGGTFQSAECFGESDPCTADTHLHPSPTEPRCWESTWRKQQSVLSGSYAHNLNIESLLHCRTSNPALCITPQTGALNEADLASARSVMFNIKKNWVYTENTDMMDQELPEVCQLILLVNPLKHFQYISCISVLTFMIYNTLPELLKSAEQ